MMHLVANSEEDLHIGRTIAEVNGVLLFVPFGIQRVVDDCCFEFDVAPDDGHVGITRIT